LAYKIRLYNSGWTWSLSANQDQSPTKKVVCLIFINCVTFIRYEFNLFKLEKIVFLLWSFFNELSFEFYWEQIIRMTFHNCKILFAFSLSVELYEKIMITEFDNPGTTHKIICLNWWNINYDLSVEWNNFFDPIHFFLLSIYLFKN